MGTWYCLSNECGMVLNTQLLCFTFLAEISRRDNHVLVICGELIGVSDLSTPYISPVTPKPLHSLSTLTSEPEDKSLKFMFLCSNRPRHDAIYIFYGKIIQIKNPID